MWVHWRTSGYNWHMPYTRQVVGRHPGMGHGMWWKRHPRFGYRVKTKRKKNEQRTIRRERSKNSVIDVREIRIL